MRGLGPSTHQLIRIDMAQVRMTQASRRPLVLDFSVMAIGGAGSVRCL